MRHVCWPTRLAISSDLRAYFIVSLSFYDFLKALSSGRKLVHRGASKGSTSSQNCTSDVLGELTGKAESASAEIWHYTRNVQDFWVVSHHSEAEAQYAGGGEGASWTSRS